MSLLVVEDLWVDFDTAHGKLHAVRNVSFSVERGRCLALVGESGGGKTVSMLALMGLIPTPPAQLGGSVVFDGQDVLALKARDRNRLRGKSVAMIFQDTSTSLDPTMRVGLQIAEGFRQHHGLGASAARRAAIDLLERARVPDAAQNIEAFPFELSGGVRQRVMIAMALACRPALLIADEPTAALDANVQVDVIALLSELQRETGMALILVTHDLGMASEIADDVAVIYAGQVVECGKASEVLHRPAHPYTAGLYAARPPLDAGGARLDTIAGTPPQAFTRADGCTYRPRCPGAMQICARAEPVLSEVPPSHAVRCWLSHELASARRRTVLSSFSSPPMPASAVQALLDSASLAPAVLGAAPPLELRNLSKHFFAGSGRMIRAVDEVSFRLEDGEVIGLVGESGCGKSTLAKTVVGLLESTAGEVRHRGQRLMPLHRSAEKQPGARKVQMIFQDVSASLDPAMTVLDIVGAAPKIHGTLTRADLRDAVASHLACVGLGHSELSRYPRELSAGQRQRVGIARALAADPDVLVCDEPVSALDVSVQAQIINLLADLADARRSSIVFISHDLAVVRHLSRRMAVMFLGQLVEFGPSEEVFFRPLHPYTQSLVASIRQSRARSASPPPSSSDGSRRVAASAGAASKIVGVGCRFQHRCPRAMPVCATQSPEYHEGAPGHHVRCHLYLAPRLPVLSAS
jgi:peptide/nickel transport system ATP-binding protein